ncbi:MAG: hypothetical protein QF890_12465 [Myxococcota bacterium]|nr:hypothetical protein [bacterium]MDP6074450.1 hypothetical protein [Myxococcota bacterium]MDP6241694.1 hypothetical protein [Myxococcota bacterium]MDP7073835.1 hypothetical protein [Myxococcota bacterium]MDP7300347.1 hypothetical protein [Myxococcota bacterium]
MSRESLTLLVASTALCAAVLGFAARHLDTPGLYYDEVIQATPASEFLREGGRPLQIPGARNTRLFGGWFPLMTQPYMSALKSQLLIPVFGLFGADGATLRRATLVWGCLGLVLCMLWMRAVWGVGLAVLAGTLLAFDPSFLFVTRHDWGSVSLALVFRGGGLWLLATGWQRDSVRRLALGGLLLGLGVTNKLDAAAFVAGAALATAVAWLGPGLRGLASRPRATASAGAGLLAGAAPMLVTLPSVLSATRTMLHNAGVRGDEWAEKLGAWQRFLDGSYFERLVLAGGSFERMGGSAEATSSAFPWLLGASAIVVAAVVLRDHKRGGADPRDVFALTAATATALLLLAVPRASRIHHVMNVLPLPQLIVALAATHLWRSRNAAVRAAAALGVTAVLAGSAYAASQTMDTLRTTGGIGRWSGTLARFAQTLPDDTVVVSLDWGFHAPLVLLRPELELEEPVWRLLHSAPGGPSPTLAGTTRHVYLVQEPETEVFSMGGALLRAVGALPHGAVRIESVRDGDDRPVFKAVRFAGPHQLVYRGEFEVLLR